MAINGRMYARQSVWQKSPRPVIIIRGIRANRAIRHADITLRRFRPSRVCRERYPIIVSYFIILRRTNSTVLVYTRRGVNGRISARRSVWPESSCAVLIIRGIREIRQAAHIFRRFSHSAGFPIDSYLIVLGYFILLRWSKFTLLVNTWMAIKGEFLPDAQSGENHPSPY